MVPQITDQIKPHTDHLLAEGLQRGIRDQVPRNTNLVKH